VRPTAESGYQACLAASDGPVAEGNVGAGTGATVGKLLGAKFAMKGGLGTASTQIGKGIVVGVIVAVNVFGDVVDPKSGAILAGTRKPVVGGFLNSAEAIKGDLAQLLLGFAHSTIGVVATNARLTKEEANVVAKIAHDGLARAIRPVHTMFDGDTLFALSLGDKSGDVSAIGSTAADVVAEAIVRAVQAAEKLHGVPAYRDLVGQATEAR
jgi:L-aminopeptidase/D-esterase-like protein